MDKAVAETLEQDRPVDVELIGCDRGWLCVNRECPARITGVPALDTRMVSHPHPRAWRIANRVLDWLDDHYRKVIIAALVVAVIGFPIWFEVAGWPNQWSGVFSWLGGR